MLGKLFKYEFKSTARTMLPIYATLLVLAFINRFFYTTTEGYFGDWSVISGISNTIYAAIIFATFIVTFVIMIQRFYKNLLGDEGYLMLTLPVKTSSHIISKLIISAIWIIGSIIVTTLSGFIIVPDSFYILFDGRSREFFTLFKSISGINFSIFFTEMVIAALIELLSAILLIYASISIGHLVQKQKIAVTIITLIVLSTISSKTSDLISTIIFGENIMSRANLIPLGTQYLPALIIGAIISTIFGAIYFCITNYVLSKRLNLQ